MNTFRVQSLRYQVEKWLAPSSTDCVRVALSGRTLSDRMRYVCVESYHSNNSHSLFFFRHGDGCWRVYPARTDAPQMTVERSQA
ncbi:hypothetical protein AWB78_07699 [Caballeronia calidae]|uniref:Uncharacterized protein n=1 Tax=Caballeronia calidae TaxID=1777139 RepID=A0A158EIQ6_9BURK|nr:hypothetical protein [Caballeronia calidae]SAL05787.1 hypothetical protein AWB78_07699 [Caballeronia calidae]